MRRHYYSNYVIPLVCVLVSISCLFVLLVSILKLPEVSVQRGEIGSSRALKFGKRSNGEGRLGELGKTMIEMLPADLAFTVFVPSEKAFERDLKLRAKASLGKENVNDTLAILSRVLSFSAVPQGLSSVEVPMYKEISFDSVSGFRLYATKALDGTLIVNTVRSEWVDIREKEIIVHVMSGVIMDAEFAQSFLPDYEDD